MNLSPHPGLSGNDEGVCGPFVGPGAAERPQLGLAGEGEGQRPGSDAGGAEIRVGKAPGVRALKNSSPRQVFRARAA